ncbi:MAG: hypothetical protein LC798_13510 [Chloroflexi bacterium]|nr:hypothetical protein [Chloroflexota bacterium]
MTPAEPTYSIVRDESAQGVSWYRVVLDLPGGGYEVVASFKSRREAQWRADAERAKRSAAAPPA